jgi:epoxyqueuosine reductase
MTAQEIKKAARDMGADLVGIASTELLKNLPPEENPLSIFPQAKAVIVIGKKILRGTLRGIEQGADTGNSFSHFGFYDLEDNFLAKTTYDLTVRMEAKGYEAVPLFAYDCDGQQIGVPVSPEKPAPNVILRYRTIAQAAGLGETGLHGLFLTPQFGARQRFAMLLTDADVEADKPFEPYICNDCGECIKACPLGALNAGETSLVGFAGFERPVAARDNSLCLRCQNGAIQTNEGRFKTVERVGAACSRACIHALEERGATEEKFTNPFRQAKPWARDMFGNKIETV